MEMRVRGLGRSCRRILEEWRPTSFIARSSDHDQRSVRRHGWAPVTKVANIQLAWDVVVVSLNQVRCVQSVVLVCSVRRHAAPPV